MDVRAVPRQPPISFSMHEVRAGRAGAREDFEQMLGLLVRAVTARDARLVSAEHGGDWGIDVLAGDLNGRAAIWQAKYFIGGVGPHQQGQIRESFASAVGEAAARGYLIEQWVLCVPASLDPAATRWWQGWKDRQQRATGVVICLWDETVLRELLARPEAADVRCEYYDWSWPRSSVPGSGLSSQAADAFLRAYRDQLRGYYGFLELPNFRCRDRVPVDEIYVPLEIRQESGPLGTPASDAGAAVRLTTEDLPGLIHRAVLLGDPGGGKSTVSSILLNSLAGDPRASVPFLVTLREYAADLHKVPVARHIEAAVESRHQCRPPSGLVERLLRTGPALVIFDGLDEVLDVAGRRDAALCIEQFCRAYPAVQVLVTSRAEAYDQGRLDSGFTRYRLGVFGTGEMAEYARRWFRWHQDCAPGEAEAFLQASLDVIELRSSPLLLALMCTLYRESGSLPRDRIDLYERCAAMLAREWDRRRRIEPDPLTRDLLRPLIQHLALWWMFTRPGQRAPIPEQELTDEIERFLRDHGARAAGEERTAAREFVEFCRERAWVLSTAANGTGRTEYRFTHQALLDYYAAAGVAQRSATPEALTDALIPRVLDHAWHFSQLAISVMDRSAPGAADRICELLLRQENLPVNRTQVLTFLSMLPGRIHLDQATVRALARATLRHRITLDLEPEKDHPLGLLLYGAGSHAELLAEEMASYIELMLASQDAADRSEALRIVLELPDIITDTYWKQWAAEQARRLEAQIRAHCPSSRELRTLALHAGLLPLDEALLMPGGLDALLEPAEQILEPSLELPYPAWLYMKIDGDVAEQEFAVIGRHIAANPGLPWTRASSHDLGISDIYHESALAEAGAPLSELAGLGLAATHAICCEMFSISPEIDGRPPANVPMPGKFRKTFRDWTASRVSVTAPRPATSPQTKH
jgi:NACHT domain